MGRSATFVDVEAVGLDPERDDLGPKLPQRVRRDVISGAIGTIDNDLEAVEPKLLGKCRFRIVHITSAGVVNPASAADHLRLGKLGSLLKPGLDRALVVVAQFVAVGAEQLDAVVRKRVVRCGDHHAQISAHRARQHRYRRRRHRPQQHDVHPDAGEARDQGRFHHVARQAGVLADDDPVAVVAAQEMLARGHADGERGLRRHRLAVGEPADSVGAEELACHRPRFSAFSRSSARSRPACPRSPRGPRSR